MSASEPDDIDRLEQAIIQELTRRRSRPWTVHWLVRMAGRLGTGVALGLLVPLINGCVLPRSFKEVRNPRGGAALNRHVCLVYSQRYQINLGGFEKLHPFDINKYGKIYLQLLTDGLIRSEAVYVPDEISREDLLRAHSAAYLDRLRQPEAVARYLEAGFASVLPAWVTDASILTPFRYATGGTLLAARVALQHGIAINLGGGYHHAEPGRGGGFCIYADMPIAIRTLQAEGLIRRALVVDLDVHQGNGTARCVAADDDVFAFDMHEEDIYPTPKAKNDIDVPLQAGTGDEAYLGLLRKNLPDVFDRAKPHIVFFQAGADVLDGDPLAHLRLTPQGVVERDRTVIDEAVRRKVPIVMVLGGGYSKDAWHVQYASIRRTIEQYGLENAAGRPYPRRPTVKERIYTK
jgi:histone deacetylase 11